jgi:hypothetical protein
LITQVLTKVTGGEPRGTRRSSGGRRLIIKALLAKTNFLPLEFCREISDLHLLFKSQMGFISMDVNISIIIMYHNFKFLLKHKQDYF